MPAFHPRFEALPAEFPVFPLPGALLLPRGRLPLNIFEGRYLAMVEDSLAAGRMFAMIQPDPHQPESATGPGLYKIGSLGRLSAFNETDDGRFLITLTGLIRFTLAAEVAMGRGYRRVRGNFAAYRSDLEGPPGPIGVGREALLAALRGYFVRRKFEANWDAVRRLDDDALIVTLSMICPFEPAEKQALLETATDADRAATLLALLQMGAVEGDVPPGRPVS
jgi:hypothetical protein